MPFSEKQLEYFGSATHRWNVKQGATRSGKTYMDYFVIPKRIRRLRGKEGLVVLLGNTKGTLQRNIIEPLQSIWGTGIVGDIRSDNTAVLFGEKCFCLGADKISQVNRLRGSSIKYCYGDEVVTWHPEVFEMLKSRLDKPYSRFDGTCNPENPNHWFKKFLDSNADIYNQHYTIDDNPFLDPGFVENLKKEYAGTVYYDRFILGKWALADGLIYRQFADNPERWLVDTVSSDIDFISIGIDFGGNRSLTTFVATAVHRAFRGLTVVMDWHITGKKGEIDSDIVNRAFIGFYQRLQAAFPGVRIAYVFADNEAQYLINGLDKACKRSGIRISIGDADKNIVVQRIYCTTTLLNTGRLWIFRSCKLVIQGLQFATWDSTKIKDTRLDNFSSDIDIIDAFEYSWERFMKKLAPDSGLKGR